MFRNSKHLTLQLIKDIKKFLGKIANTLYEEDKEYYYWEIKLREKTLNFLIEDEKLLYLIEEYLLLYDLYCQHMHTDKDLKKIKELEEEIYNYLNSI